MTFEVNGKDTGPRGRGDAGKNVFVAVSPRPRASAPRPSPPGFGRA